MTAEGGATLEGRVLDLSSSGLGIAFLREGAPDLDIDQDVVVTLESPVILRSLHIVGTLRRWVIDGLIIRAGVAFDPSRLDDFLPESLRPDFNRRKLPRVQPSQPLEGRVVDGDQETAVEVVNISPGGAALRVERDRGRLLTDGGRFELVFEMPGEPREFSFMARVCADATKLSSTVVNVEFLAEGTSDYDTQIALLQVFTQMLVGPSAG